MEHTTETHGTPGEIHATLIQILIQTGICPASATLGTTLGMSKEGVERGLRALEAMHGVVLHPYAPEPWVIHPFSTTPTLNYVSKGDKGWWAPCIWCALGVAHLLGGQLTITSRFGAETEQLVLEVRDGQIVGAETLVVHFAVPPRQAWNNVHAHCAYVLPFASAEGVKDCCARHGVAQGEIVALRQVNQLAQRWYGPYADRNWTKWTVEEAQQIFNAAGLTSPFWQLEGEGTY